MRRQAALKIVPTQEDEKVQRSSSAVNRESLIPSLERNFFGTLDSMEKVVHDSFARAFGSFMPLQAGHLLGRFGSLTGFSPAIDMYEERNQLVVKAELPGIDKNDLNVRVLDNAIVITGEKKSERSEQNKGYLRVERSSGSFERTIALPEGVTTDKATARFTDGILEIRMPKKPAQHVGRKIQIE